MQMNLDEAAKSYIGIPIDRVIDEEERYYISDIGKYDAFIDGAKWQGERMYSKEEVLQLMCKAFEVGFKKYDVVEAGLEGLETEIECNWILKKYGKK
jgi:hypothetical protein